MLKVMTLNINYYGTKHGLWPIRKKFIQEAIQNANPDIIALQAVKKDPVMNNGLDQASQFAELLPEYQYRVFQESVNYENGSSDGLAFLSRFEIAKTDYLKLTLHPGLEDTNQRIVLNTLFHLPTGPFHIFNAHFSWVYQQALDNVNETLPYINSFAKQSLFVGDLNMTSDTEIIRQFNKDGWVDIWAELRPDDNGYTFESNHPTKRIDYAWIHRSLKQQVKSIEIIANNHDENGNWPSDHAGLLIQLSTHD